MEQAADKATQVIENLLVDLEAFLIRSGVHTVGAL